MPTVFTKNRDRLLTTEMSRKVMAAILARREVAPLLSDDHFSVDGTLVKAWASMKSFQPKVDDTTLDDDAGSSPGPDTPAKYQPTITETDAMSRPNRQNRNAKADFKGEKRTNTTHASATDPDAVLHRPCANGEPLGPDRAGWSHPGRRPWRTARGARHDPPTFPRIDPATDTWRGRVR